jgi:long-chain acyl-CoA synthetase
MGVIDARGNVFIKGRCKNLIVGANGQNIYPEEIEDKLNSLPLVAESLVVERNNQLVALIFPVLEKGRKALTPEAMAAKMEENRLRLNEMLPAYSRVAKVELRESEFEKTPKRSIKRFLYK